MSASILPIRSAAAIAQAVTALRAGELIIVPTDTVYGLATLPENTEAIERLYAIRQRPHEPAFPLLLAENKSMYTLARVNQAAARLVQRFWPGALTVVLPPAANLPAELHDMPIALRMPNYPALHPLLKAVGDVLFVSGATSSGYPPAITAQEAADYFGEQVAVILDGGHTPFGVPSTIVDCTQSPPVIVRRGTIPEEKIWETLKPKRVNFP